MKILWLTNKIIPHVHRAMGKEATLVNEGWITQMFEKLCNTENIEMHVFCGGSENLSGKAEKFSWYTFTETAESETYYSEQQKNTFSDILRDVKPDIIHIWGTEYPHTLAMILAAKENGLIDRTVAWLQGIISVCSHYSNFYCDIPQNVIKSKTFYDSLRHTGLEDVQKKFAQRGLYEMRAISEIRHVIGRTDWDKKCAQIINSDVNYHFCNETLRADFYFDSWTYDKCQNHSIFVSQATYSIKGFHLLLRALPSLIEKYPDIHVFVGGADPTGGGSLKEVIKATSYRRYIKQLIEKENLRSHITFMGRMQADKMKEMYLKANLFLSCSSIENSPNSVGEAMLLGTPVVSSDVGGVRSIIEDKTEGILYRWNDTTEMIKAISNVFDDPDSAVSRSAMAKRHAAITHNPQTNYETLMDIYNNIAQS